MGAEVIQGDCLEVMPTLEADSIDALISDPPYGLSFMGKNWDRGVPGVAFWVEARRVMKAGSYLLAFGGTRTYHRLACAIEDAGFEVQDCLSWLYGSGFPKHKSKLKPAWEPIIMARKPAPKATLLNIDACRIGTREDEPQHRPASASGIGNGKACYGTRNGQAASYVSGRWPANVVLDEWDEQILYLRDTISSEIFNLIAEYFHDYRRLSNVREWGRNVPESQGAKEVLQPRVLREGADIEAGADDGQEAHARSGSEDDRRETASGEAGAGQPDVEGLVPDEGLCDDLSSGPACDPGASAGHGADSRTPIASLGSGSSPERGEGRQPPREPRADGSRNAQARTPGNRSGTPRITTRERTLAVLACDVPPRWRQYFRDSGYVVRSPDAAAALLDEQSGTLTSGGGDKRGGCEFFMGTDKRTTPTEHSINSGGASRFFYTAKASRSERDHGLEGSPLKDGGIKNDSGRGYSERDPYATIKVRNNHPTVKPVELMRWLCRLVTPPQGRILDPFTGSGTTGVAATLEGFSFVGIEREEEYAAIARKRIAETPPSLFGEVA